MGAGSNLAALGLLLSGLAGQCWLKLNDQLAVMDSGAFYFSVVPASQTYVDNIYNFTVWWGGGGGVDEGPRAAPTTPVTIFGYGTNRRAFITHD